MTLRPSPKDAAVSGHACIAAVAEGTRERAFVGNPQSQREEDEEEAEVTVQ